MSPAKECLEIKLLNNILLSIVTKSSPQVAVYKLYIRGNFNYIIN